MERPKPFDEVEVALQLIGPVDEQLVGLRRLDQEYRPRVFAHLRAHYNDLPAQALELCYRDAIAGLATQILAYHRDPKLSRFDPDRPLLPLLKEIAYRRAVDLDRRSRTQAKAIRAAEDRLRGGGGFVAREGPTLVEREEFRALVYQAVAHLPRTQQVVWGSLVAYCFEFDSIPSDEELKDYLSRRTGTPWTMAAVRGGKRNGKEALREHLKSRGYDIDW